VAILLVQGRRRRLAEESLREKMDELEHFFDVTLDLLCVANTDGYFVRLGRLVPGRPGKKRHPGHQLVYQPEIRPDGGVSLGLLR